MEFLNTSFQWVQQNWLFAAMILAALLNLALRFKSPEAWVAFCESFPRGASLIRIVRAAGFDPPKALAALIEFVTGKARVDKLDRPLDSKEQYVIKVTAEIDAALAALEALKVKAQETSAAVQAATKPGAVTQGGG